MWSALFRWGRRKEKGFRLTSPDGFYTDFYLDEKTGLISSYESTYEMNGRTFTTSIEVDKYRVVDGISVPERYSQRFDLGPITAYANFKAKDILINSKIDDAVFGASREPIPWRSGLSFHQSIVRLKALFKTDQLFDSPSHSFARRLSACECFTSPFRSGLEINRSRSDPAGNGLHYLEKLEQRDAFAVGDVHHLPAAVGRLAQL